MKFSTCVLYFFLVSLARLPINVQ